VLESDKDSALVITNYRAQLVRIKLGPEAKPNQFENDEWQVLVGMEDCRALMSVTSVAGNKMILRYEEENMEVSGARNLQ
jgi:hypothetical protein